MSLATELQARGFIQQCSAADLKDVVDKEKRVIYHGIDPSADSAHVGNMVIWMLLLHLAKAGHEIVFLVGGATGMIGDPKPDAERTLRTNEEINECVAKIKLQAENFFVGHEITFVNNIDWLGEMKLLEFLRDIGKHYTVNELIKKEAIANRLQSETGLSYTEFAYPLLQGYDFLQLFESKNCTVQVGGSDQWGNIISGVDLIRRKKQAEAFAITTPLVVDKATGKKFGKSEGNAVWLDDKKTSPYEFYQFWLNMSDESVIEHLKRFTLLSLSEIEKIESEQNENKAERVAQKALAAAVTGLVHGADNVNVAVETSNILFGNEEVSGVSELVAATIAETAPSVIVNADENVVDLLVRSELAQSKREAREFIQNGAVSINNTRITDVDYVVLAMQKGISVLKRGKKKLCVLRGE